MPSVSGRTIMVLGGWGLVGRAICYELLKENPKEIILCSLRESESQEAVSDLTGEIQFLNDTGKTLVNTALVPEWGDIFLCTEYKDRNIREMTEPAHLDRIISDTFDDLSKVDLSHNFLYHLIARYRPDILIDAVNTATGVAYRDVYASVLDLRLRMAKIENLTVKDGGYADEIAGLMQSLRLHITAIELPRLIRHVQVIYNAMKTAGTQIYFKIGTTGTGGMGLNIPYTHSEEKPSQKLLAKSAVAGAHSLLLFLMNNTPGFAYTMEVKPAAAIAWKAIEYGTVSRAGAPIMLFDNDPKTPFNVSRSLDLNVTADGRVKALKQPLKAVYINTGENGLFSRGEFESITTTGQMEYVTPEEIAQAVKEEMQGANTGYDIIETLSNTVMKSTYRAGVMREHALDLLRQLEEKNGDESVAFEILGPPRLSKLLYEAHLLKKNYKSVDGVIRSTPEAMSRKLALTVKNETALRTRIISIGIPILLPDGKSMLRGPKVIVPPFRGANTIPIDAQSLDKFCAEGWVDLRPENMRNWQARMLKLKAEIESMDWKGRYASTPNTSSRLHRKHYEIDENGQKVLNIGEVVGWIFNEEEEGSRKTYSHPRVKIPKPI